MNDLPTLLATSLCQTLFEAGYIAYFAGGWVRDRLLGRTAHEVDIATSAPPEVVQQLFPHTVPIGIAFGVILVNLEGFSFEVATFRHDHPYRDGRHPEAVDFSSPEEDALRRDFTINGLFYDPLCEAIYDYVGGEKDIKAGLIRAIGDPIARFTEDRLRMLRAVRFAAQLGFPIEPATAQAIQELAPTLFPSVSRERVWQELDKMLHAPTAAATILRQLHDLKLLRAIFPECLPKEALERAWERIAKLPVDFPTALYLLELLPYRTVEARYAWCTAWKCSHAIKQLVTFVTESLLGLASTQPSWTEWAHFYAHDAARHVIALQAAYLPADSSACLQAEHVQRRTRLQEPIRRIQTGTPLVSAALLIERGIPPGRELGRLLKKAEAIAIEYELSTPEAVMAQLFSSPDR